MWLLYCLKTAKVLVIIIIYQYQYILSVNIYTYTYINSKLRYCKVYKTTFIPNSFMIKWKDGNNLSDQYSLGLAFGFSFKYFIGSS